MEIHYATIEDLDRVVPLFEGYLKFYEKNYEYEAIQTFMSKRLKNDDSIILLALHNDEAIGFAQMYPSFSSLALKRSYILNDLFVKPEHRKLGAAEARMVEAFAFCEQMGAASITLETHESNVSAQKLYEKIGMEREVDFYHYMKEIKK